MGYVCAPFISVIDTPSHTVHSGEREQQQNKIAFLDVSVEGGFEEANCGTQVCSEEG